MYKLNGGLPVYNTDCFSYWQGTIQASYAVMRQLLFYNHKRHMFIANLNDDNDSLIGKFAGNRLNGLT